MRKSLITAGVAVLAAGLIACGSGSGNDEPDTATTTAAPAAKATSKPADPGPRTKIAGDDTVHVGYDVAAGSYRTVSDVKDSGFCYWVKSTDPEAAHIIKNDIPSGGKPQVTLTKGQWFTSKGCPNWAKVTS